MVNGLHLYSAFIQSAVQFMPLIHPFTHTFTHQRRLAAMQGTNQLVRSNLGLGVLLRDTSTRPGWDRTGNPPTARRQLLPPEPYRPRSPYRHTRSGKSGMNAGEHGECTWQCGKDIGLIRLGTRYNGGEKLGNHEQMGQRDTEKRHWQITRRGGGKEKGKRRGLWWKIRNRNTDRENYFA